MNHNILNSNFEKILQDYTSNQCFVAEHTTDNAYRRPLSKKDIERIDPSTPISLKDVYSDRSLILNQLLFSIYEQDLLFLDTRFKNNNTYDDFKMYYDPNFAALGKALKPTLEYLVFHFLYTEIEIIGTWDVSRFYDYVTNVVKIYEDEKSALCNAIVCSLNKSLAAKMMLIQMAPDFLSEASAMARALPGSFGEEQSELMKVFIDEYGYGVHRAKHSTLFEKTLSSAGLSHEIHRYYQQYLPSSLMISNYFHYLCSNRANWFKHMGALYYSEAVIPHFNKQVSRTLKECIEHIDTDYFDEHVHIDKHHTRMVLENIIMPSIKKYGEVIINDVIYGIESFRLLLNIADTEIIQKIKLIT